MAFLSQPNPSNFLAATNATLFGNPVVLEVEIIETQTGYTYRQLQFGGVTTYIAVNDGDRLGFKVTNMSNYPIGVPFFVEGQNIYSGGAQTPQQCQGNDMWELMPNQEIVISGTHNSQTQEGRNFVISDLSQGLSIAQNVSQDKTLRGIIRMFLKFGELPQYQSKGGGYQSFGGGASRSGASVGLGASQHQSSTQSGILYNSQTADVLKLQFEYYRDLSVFMQQQLGSNWNRFVDNRPRDQFANVPTSRTPFRG